MKLNALRCSYKMVYIIQFFRMIVIFYVIIIIPFTLQKPSDLELNAQQSKSSSQRKQCNCIKFIDCKILVDLITKQQKNLTEELILDLRRRSCGFDKNDPLICCPEYYTTSTTTSTTTTEPPWVWDVRKLFTKQSEENTNTHKFVPLPSSSSQNDLSNRFNDFDDYHLNLIDFEDPKTLKNCPPNFYDYDGSRYRHFHHHHHHHRDHHDFHSFQFENKDKNSWDMKFHPQPPFAEFPVNNDQHYGFDHQFLHHGNHKPKVTGGANVNNNNDKPPFRRKPSNVDKNENAKRKVLNSSRCGISVGTRINGGIDAGPGQFPWMARLAYRNRSSGRISYRCAGSVINDRYVVTAAHCVTNLIESLEIHLVRIGELDTKRELDCTNDPLRCNTPQDYNIEKLIPHPKYDTPKYANDIALIRLSINPNTAQVTPICLPFDEFAKFDKSLTGKMAIVAGWGVSLTTKESRRLTLQWVRLPIVNRTQCAQTYAEFSANSRTPIIVSSSQICVQGKENMDACQGDSGGPLMDEGDVNAPRYTLLGLVSFGPRTCGVSNFPGVYTRISSFINWILNAIE